MVERAAVNRDVEGSSPSSGAKRKIPLFQRGLSRREGQIEGDCQQNVQQKTGFCATPQQFALTPD